MVREDPSKNSGNPAFVHLNLCPAIFTAHRHQNFYQSHTYKQVQYIRENFVQYLVVKTYVINLLSISKSINLILMNDSNV